MNLQDKANSAVRSRAEIKLDALLHQMTDDMIKEAGRVAYLTDAYDETHPTSVRLDRRTRVFFSTLADQLGISTNGAILLILKSFAHGARPKDQ